MINKTKQTSSKPKATRKRKIDTIDTNQPKPKRVYKKKKLKNNDEEEEEEEEEELIVIGRFLNFVIISLFNIILFALAMDYKEDVIYALKIAKSVYAECY